jgi:RNA ligase (TIGR02306 family)
MADTQTQPEASERTLATIQTIDAIDAIPGADAIEFATILGWKVVVKKGEFNIGEKVVYFEVDSFLPEIEIFEWLRRTSFRSNEFLGRNGFRIKTMKLRGQISQGLVIGVAAFPEISSLPIGANVTKKLDVVKWQLPELEGNFGTRSGSFSPYCSKTEETRVQSIPAILDELKGKPYYITTKIDGTSATITYLNGQLQAFSHNFELADDGKSVFWDIVDTYDLRNKLANLGQNLAIQGELAGPKIQKNKLRLMKNDLFVFTMVDLNTRKRLPLAQMTNLCVQLGLKMVPVEETGESFQYSLDDLLAKAKGFYASGLKKEGIVVRPQTPIQSYSTSSNLSFKVLNNNALLSEE